MLRRTITVKIMILGIFASSFLFAVTKITEPKIEKFVDKMVTEHDFNKDELTKLLLSTTYQADAIAAMKKPAEKLPWHKYQKIFLKDNRIQAGVEFWLANRKSLERAQKEYGVPPEIIVSLIGVETFYGKYKGKFPVLDSLVTLAFYYEPRAKFFTSELEQFLLYAREEKADPKIFYGSYAGAMGYPQFISSSIRNYAVDFTKNGHRDLQNNIDDAIGSVANYLNKHGWTKGQPITTKAKLKGNKYTALDKYTNQLKPSLTIQKLKNYGIVTSQPYKDKLQSSLLSFDLEKQNKEYWLGFNNFYVISRYNHSQNYALAVYQLSEKIKLEYAKNDNNKKKTRLT